MGYSSPPTSKGARQAQEILDAALVCLGRDGYAATSLARVADEAGVSKRMVLYYFSSREELFDRLAESIGDRLLQQLEEAISGLEDPREVVEAGFEQLWAAFTADRALLIALFGVSIEGVTDTQLGSTVTRFKNRFRALMRRQIAEARSHGRKLIIDEDVAVTIMITGFLGIAMEWLETGDTPALKNTIIAFERMVASLAPPVD